MKRTNNTPILVIIGVLSLLFIVPFTLAVIAVFMYGEFTVPENLMAGVLSELNPNLVLGMLITVLPLLVVVAVERARQQSGGARSMGLTVGLLIVLMAAVTAVPAIAYLRPLAGLPAGHAMAILAVVALPLLLIAFIALILLPSMVRGGDAAPPGVEGEPEG
jgi:hypothetical protein